jgi:hypothetical protein
MIEQVFQIMEYNQWINNIKINHSYSNNLLSETIEQEWNDNQWTNYNRRTIIYDINGNFEEETLQIWDDDEWQFSGRNLYSYVNNLFTELVMQSYQNNEWVNHSYHVMEYDANDNFVTQITQSWIDNEWVNIMKFDLCYEEYTGTNDIINSHFSFSNYPNPFNPTTTISFSVPEENLVSISIFNAKGQKIKSLIQNDLMKGQQSIVWNGDNEFGKPVSSGVYYIKLTNNGKTGAVTKCLLLK